MTSDGNRGATLTYNYLNLPKTVVIGGKTLAYDYDAAGNKHKYVADTLTVKYAGIFEYDANNVLKRIGTAEGQVVPGGDTLRFDYFLKDHLGNNRVVFDERGKTLQLNDYYPFGLSISRDGTLPQNARNGINRYLYNDKELQGGTGLLDYGARMYMPEIGRMSSVDNAANLYQNMSPYSYGLNNPLLNVDPSGDTTYAVTDLNDNWNNFKPSMDEVNLNEATVVRPEYQKLLDQMYFNDLAAFSPWQPDAYGVQFNASASGMMGEAGFSLGVAMDNKGIAPFVSTGIGLGASPPGIDFSLQFTMSKRANTSRKHQNLNFVDGVDIGNSYGLGLSLSESQTSLNNNPFSRDPNGYNTYGFGIGLSFGYKRTYSTTTSTKIDFRKR